jgi:very-short-patch-repair endonuclease
LTPRSVPLKFTRARRLRRAQTDAEMALWRRLKSQQLDGLKFRRQFPIGNYIADFCCRECKLVIELDGGQHADPLMLPRDRYRTKKIEERGYSLIRFWDNEVLTNIEEVLQAILSASANSVLE